MTIQGIKQRYGIIGRSEDLDRVISIAMRVAPTNLSVLITGESGVGKEAFSKIIHNLSPRKHNPFIAINCGAIPEGTINSELFGHEKGAFTGASADRKGYFETVNGGSIFLDEVGEMPLDTQSYLLRVLESGEFIRVGSSVVHSTDVRVIAATNLNLIERVKQGKFREDLFYRLSTVPIFVPSLKERKEDIMLLFRKFSIDFAEKYRIDPITLEPDAKRLLENYSWPGNIRELKNIAEQLAVLSEDRLISVEDLVQINPQFGTRHLPAINSKNTSGESMEEREILYKLLFDMKSDLNDLKSLVYGLIQNNDLDLPDSQPLETLQIGNRDFKAPQPINYPLPNRGDYTEAHDNGLPILLDKDFDDTVSEEVEESLSLEDMEKNYIQRALKKYRGRRKDAALELGISERTLYRKIKQYDID